MEDQWKYDGRRFGESQSFGGHALDKAESVKEDIKGGARRLEGELRDDEGLKSEHDPSILERMGESIKEGAQAVGETLADGARRIGLISEKKDEPRPTF